MKQYPAVDENELKSLIKVKESEIGFSKIITHDSTDMIVYFIDKIPYFFKFEKDDQLMPTGKRIILKYSTYLSSIYSSLFFVEISQYFAKVLHT